MAQLESISTSDLDPSTCKLTLKHFLISSTREEREATFSTITMIAGGTGITPFYQLIQNVINSEDSSAPKLNLIFANKTIDDILLRESLEALAAEGKIDLTLTVDQIEDDESWENHVGFLTKELLEVQLAAPGDEHLVMYCGPPPMNDHVRQALLDIGHAENNVVKY